MGTVRQALGLFIASFVSVAAEQALGEASGPPAGYFDIPAGFDFPANSRLLEQYRSQPHLPAQRLHAWNVFAGMTQRTPDNKFAIFETWFSEDETFSTATVAAAAGPRTVVRRFRIPAQFESRPGALAAVQPPGSAAMSFVLYNFAAYNHVRSNRLFLGSVLDGLAKSGAPDAKIPQSRTIPPFPAASVVLKTVWWPVAKDKISAMPIWDPELNPPLVTGNPVGTWARYVGVDATRQSIPAGETADIVFDGQVKRGSHIVGLGNFHSITLDQNGVDTINNGPLGSIAQQSFGRNLEVGDFAVLLMTHLTTKEIDDWVWATFWWHDKPNHGPFAADRVGSIAGPWRNYLLTVAYDLNLPPEKDGSPRVAFNPWLEGRFADGGHGGGGLVSNCMNCHNRASWPRRDVPDRREFLPVYRGNPDLSGDPAYAPGRLRTDFLWSIPDQAQ